MQLEELRQEFEEWWAHYLNHPSEMPTLLARAPNGQYLDYPTHHAWQTFRIGAERERQRYLPVVEVLQTLRDAIEGTRDVALDNDMKAGSDYLGAWLNIVRFALTSLGDSQAQTEPAIKTANCHDCARPYEHESGFADLLLPNEVWSKISPDGDGGGLLCPCCIIARLTRAGYTDVDARFVSGPFLVDDGLRYSAQVRQRKMEEALKAWDRWHYAIQSAKVNSESSYTARDFEVMRDQAVRMTAAALTSLGEGAEKTSEVGVHPAPIGSVEAPE